ncbi:heavy metal translocating P-type ATPase [Micromonospora sp. NPDC051141]|uniref:heavy metal translocating P-type ATPase n=1 Tax=Micromonospora sp. NPDC051141 TaxID=3364284 RepID=UPI0037BDC891
MGHAHHAGHDPEQFRRRFWLSLALTVPIVLTSHMVMDWFGYSLAVPGVRGVGPVLGTVVFGYGGWPFLAGGLRELRARAPGMMLLISMAIVVAYLASVATSLGLFDLDFWWELAALVTIMLLGHWQEMRAVGQARGALGALAALLPDDAERLDGTGRPQPVPVAELRVGDLVLVRPGGRVPADGRIVEGAAELDESMITGESRPVSRAAGDRVVAGTVATDATLRVRVDAVGADTALAGIGRLVAEAQSSGGRAQVLADRFAALLFYLATTAGLVTFVVWLLLGDTDQAVVRTVTVLVIACPHALGLAIPLVVALSTALSARAGILVKDRLALERMRTVDTVLFDKTGTLTTGRHTVTGVAATGGLDRDAALRLAGAVEADSEHPLARALVAAADARSTRPAATDAGGPNPAAGDAGPPGPAAGDGGPPGPAAGDGGPPGPAAGDAGPPGPAAAEPGPTRPAAHGFRALAGRGVRATVDGVDWAVGGPALLRELDAAVPDDLARVAAGWSRRGAAVLHLVRLPAGHDPEVTAAFALEDRVRPEARAAVAELRELGVRKIVMITGDARPVAGAVAADLGFRPGVDEVFAEVLPADKDKAVADLQARGLTVAMVGDGVNDAPALARADVGVAIGAGTDVAIESAGVVLAGSDPRGVGGVIRLSRESYRKMRQNLAWAAGYNVVAIPLAAGVLAGAGVALSPALGAVLMSASTIVVALNAQLLRRVRLTPTGT